MKTIMKIGMAVIVMGIFANFISGGNSEQEADLPALIQGGALIVDVRTASEFAARHIENAVNIPYDVISRDIGSYAPDKDRTLILYCHSGARAAAAQKSLMQLGYTHIVNARTLRAMLRALDQ